MYSKEAINMITSMNNQFGDWLRADKERTTRLIIMLFPAAYVLNVLMDLFSCNNSLLACGMHDFVVVFPFYVFLSQFANHLNFFAIILLYLAGSAIYLAAFYFVIAWLQEWRLRVKSRPHFILKRI